MQTTDEDPGVVLGTKDRNFRHRLPVESNALLVVGEHTVVDCFPGKLFQEDQIIFVESSVDADGEG